MSIPYLDELDISAGAEDELAGHRLAPDDALEVSWGSPKFFRDKVDGRYRMIGRNFAGVVLTIITEPTRHPGRWEVVTGWPSSKGEITMWHKAGGR